MRPAPQNRRSGRLAILAILALLVALSAAGLGLWGWQVAARAQQLAAQLKDLEAAARGADLRSWPELCAKLAATGAAAADLRRVAGPGLPLAARLAPGVDGRDAAAVAPLLDVAVSAGSAGEAICRELTAITAPAEPGRATPELAVARLAAAGPHLAAARAELEAAGARLGQVDPAALSPAIGARVAQLRDLLPAAQDGVTLALALPALLGAEGRRDYLVVAQNPDEIRPTGGFISAAGLLSLEGGRVLGLRLEDSGLVDNPAGGEYPLAPEPIRRYMVVPAMAPGLWSFRDANWSPDFPTSARAMLDFYRLGKGREPDGVIAFSPEAIRLLLAAVGPVAVEAASEPVSAQNLEAYLRTVYSEAREQGRNTERKEGLSRLAAALLERLGAHSQLNLATLAQAARLAFERRELVVYLPEGAAADLLARYGWDGALRAGAADFVLLASANVGYNKVGPNITQSLSYAVDLSDPAAPLAAARVTHRNSSAGGPGCRPLERSGPRYEDLIEECYWSYLRLYVPGGAVLTSYHVPAIPDSWMINRSGDRGRVYHEPGEGGTEVFGALVVVPRQSEHELTFRYLLPPTVLVREGELWRYRLVVRRQPGLQQQAQLQVLLPPGAVVVSSSHPPRPQGGQIFGFELPLATDTSFELVFHSP